MLFNSWEFILLTAITFFFYYLPGFRRFQVYILLLSSLFFYGFDRPLFLGLLVASILLNAVGSFAISRGRPERRKIVLTFTVGLNLATLAFFKYKGLLFETFGSTGFNANETVRSLLTIGLPVGISFFTFEGISLAVDSYRGRDTNASPMTQRPAFREHLRNIALFVSFFPHLVAGPILKAHEFLPQIQAKLFSAIPYEYAFRRVVLGYFLKMVVADHLSELTLALSMPALRSYSSLELAALLFGYSIQIFADFWGYSLIALGIGALFGYRLPKNFNYPYIAMSFSDFWNRWHMSLSKWLREYLYLPLGGNRRGEHRTYANLMTVMLLGGLWHGAAWSYAAWGAWHGLLLVVERVVRGNREPSSDAGLGRRALRGGFVFALVTLGWLFFKLPRFSDVIVFFKAFHANWNLTTNVTLLVGIALYSLPVIILHGLELARTRTERFRDLGPYEAWIYGLLIFFIVVNSGNANSFIYFEF